MAGGIAQPTAGWNERRSWLRASAVRTLAAGTNVELGYALLESLLDDAIARRAAARSATCRTRRRDAARWDPRQASMRVGLPRRYVGAGPALGDEQGLPAWSSVRHSQHSVPVAMPWVASGRSGAADPLAEYPARIRWPSQRPIQAWTREAADVPPAPPAALVDWLEMFARRDAPGQPGGEAIARIKEGWREPLIEELSKETYNAMTELQAVLESEAWDDAARLITSLDPEAAPGVAPYVNDKALLTSLPVAVQLTLADYPQLRESLGERFAAWPSSASARRSRRAMPATIELATVQFAGTEAAAEAHQWLGDRALASGWFAQAIAEYQRLAGDSALARRRLAPRIRLAAAMLGRDEHASPSRSPCNSATLNMPAAEFEALAAEMRSAAGKRPACVDSADSRHAMLAAEATAFEAHVRSRLDGPVGDKPQEEVGRRTNQFRVPWADRQIATAVEGDLLYVSNRFQVAAYNLTNGQRNWQSQPPPGAMPALAGLGDDPHAAADHGGPHFRAAALFVEPAARLPGQVDWQTALDRASRSTASSSSPIPVIVQGQLVALSTAIQQDNQGILRWCSYDPQTGELQQQRDLVRLRNTWGSGPAASCWPTDDGLVAVLGGMTLAVDTAGNVRWVRKHVATLPADEDPRWVLQTYQPPLLDGERMYVAQPGVRSVDCLDWPPGKQLERRRCRKWSAWSAWLEVGSSRAPRPTFALSTLPRDKRSGAMLPRSCTASNSPTTASCCVAAREQLPKQQFQTRLTWLDPATGQATATTPLPTSSIPIRGSGRSSPTRTGSSRSSAAASTIRIATSSSWFPKAKPSARARHDRGRSLAAADRPRTDARGLLSARKRLAAPQRAGRRPHGDGR